MDKVNIPYIESMLKIIEEMQSLYRRQKKEDVVFAFDELKFELNQKLLVKDEEVKKD